MTTGFRVRPGELAAAGRAARTTAEQLRRELTVLVDATDPAVAALPGWRTAAALHDCADAWRRVLVGLADQLAGIGADLERTSANYDTAEADAHHTLHRVG